MIGRDLLLRIVSAAVLIAIVATGAWFGGVAAAAVTAAAVAIIHFEWSGITEKAVPPTIPFTAVVVAAIIAGGMGYHAVAILIALVGALVAAFVERSVWRPLGVAYATVFGLSLLAIRDPALGFQAIAFLFAVVSATDSAAFFAGRLIGGPKLWPAISPRKTWAGAIAGFVAANVAGVAVVAIAGLPVKPAIVAVASILSIAGQFGDLFESWVKRRFGAKDSGNIMPGHGGLMDRIDGLVFAGPVAVLIGFLHGGSDLARGLIAW